MLQKRQDTHIRMRAAQEKVFRAQQRQLSQKLLPSSREEQMRILDQQRATMVTRNVDVQRIRVEDEALQRQQLFECQRNELMNPTTDFKRYGFFIRR